MAKLTIKRIKKDLDAGITKDKHYVQAIEKYLIPCFGNTHVDSIDGAKLRELDAFREQKLGRVPNRSTITTHNVALKRVFKVAIEKGFMPPAQVPDLVNKGKKTQTRPYFDKADYDKLVQSLRPFSKTGHSKRTQDVRMLLWDYVLIPTTQLPLAERRVDRDQQRALC